jgi:uncharacterized membrane protein YcaP (DUF421 family)
MPMNFEALFAIDISPLELIVRGSLMYWFLFLMFRFVLRRDAGSLSIADLLLIVLVADASQNAMSGGYDSVAEGCILVGTIAGWNYAIDWLSFHVPAIRRVAEPPPLPLIRNGRMQRANMRQQLMTVDELKSLLRQQGIEDMADVKVAYMEGDGEISILRTASDDEKGAAKQVPRGRKTVP